jgi:sec-independent protein translocase protein TatA
MPNIGGPELVIILVIFILLFGARKLPELGSSVGKSIKNFKKGIDEGKDDDVAAGTTGGVGAEEATPVQRHDAP